MHPIYIRLTFDRKHTYIKIAETKLEDWDENRLIVKPSHKFHKSINKLIKEKDMEAYNLILEYESEFTPITQDYIIKKMKGAKRSETLTEYFHAYIEELEQKDQDSYCSSVRSMLRKIVRYHGGEDIRFHTINASWLRKLDLFLYREGAGKRTIFNYMVIIRMLFNRAIQDHVVKQEFYPFTTYKIKMPSSEKIGLSKSEIESFIKQEFDGLDSEFMYLAKWTWILSFAFGGVRSSDTMRIKWTDFKDGHFYYIMKKNNKPLCLPISDLAQQALNFFERYRFVSKGYVTPVFRLANIDDPKDMNRKITNANRIYNEKLKKIAAQAGINKNITMHIARHSFGSITGDKISPQLLQMIYRHSDIQTTMNYQQNWTNQEKLNDAFGKVIDF